MQGGYQMLDLSNIKLVEFTYQFFTEKLDNEDEILKIINNTSKPVLLQLPKIESSLMGTIVVEHPVFTSWYNNSCVINFPFFDTINREYFIISGVLSIINGFLELHII